MRYGTRLSLLVRFELADLLCLATLEFIGRIGEPPVSPTNYTIEEMRELVWADRRMRMRRGFMRERRQHDIFWYRREE
jgi:hypothetical protein